MHIQLEVVDKMVSLNGIFTKEWDTTEEATQMMLILKKVLIENGDIVEVLTK